VRRQRQAEIVEALLVFRLGDQASIARAEQFREFLIQRLMPLVGFHLPLIT